MPADDLRLPHSGDVVIISRAASVQFTSMFNFRVIRVLPWSTYDGWCWLEGYVLDPAGNAVERRRLFVQTSGLLHPEASPNLPLRDRPTGNGPDHYTGHSPEIIDPNLAAGEGRCSPIVRDPAVGLAVRRTP